jgi:hypothetical protein
MARELERHMEEKQKRMDVESGGCQPLAPYAHLKHERVVITCPPSTAVIGKSVNSESVQKIVEDSIYVLASSEAIQPYL